MKYRKIIGIFFLSFILTGTVYAKKAPEFTFKDINGKEVSLSDYKGKVVLVNFWATWCGPCLHEMPALEKLNKNYTAKGLQILGLTVSSKEEQIKEKIAKTGVKYPILINTEPAVEKFGGFSSIPQTFFINKEGEIVKQLQYAASYEEFEKIIMELL